MNALWGQILVEAAETLHTMQPGAQVIVREVLAGDALRPLRSGDVDVMCAGYPLDGEDVTIGPALLQERALLVVSADHPFAHRESVSPEDLAEVALLSTPTMPAAWTRARSPDTTPSGVPIPRGPVATSIHQALALITLGHGAFVFGDKCMAYHRHPGRAAIPISDFPAIEWGLVHLDCARTPLLQAFSQVAAALAHDHANHPG